MRPDGASWHNQLARDGTPLTPATPARVLYHLFLGIAEVDRLLKYLADLILRSGPKGRVSKDGGRLCARGHPSRRVASRAPHDEGRERARRYSPANAFW